MDVTAKYRDGQFTVSAGGVEAHFTYEEIKEQLHQAHQRAQNVSSLDVLRQIAFKLAVALKAYMQGHVNIYQLTDSILGCLTVMFNHFIDKVVGAVMYFAAPVAEVAWGLVFRFFAWIFRLV